MWVDLGKIIELLPKVKKLPNLVTMKTKSVFVVSMNGGMPGRSSDLEQ